MSGVFDKLAPFIQDYIYSHNWEELREIQVACADIIFNTDENLLAATPTASGKTEAVFLPAITEIYNHPLPGVGILYIAPLKALINDQFLRIEELLEDSYIPVTKWHGDASASLKKMLLKKPLGVLQTTPESLEAMVMKRMAEIVTLFSNLRFIIIDEVHSFIESDRGIQLISILERIQKIAGIKPRRIGLSATLGDIGAAEEWLCSGSDKKCITPMISSEKRRAIIMVSHMYTENAEPGDSYYNFLYEITARKKSIIFSNSRLEVERNISALKKIAKKKSEPDVFLVHHGNIAKSIREYTEQVIKYTDDYAVVGATVTLELGIDLGDLERIVQTGTPHSTASLSQRLGRSGRKSGLSEMCFLFGEEAKEEEAHKSINWNFLKCIALIELYREGWIEPLRAEKFPYGMLYHQTLSFLYGYGESSPPFLAESILGQKIFKHIPLEDYKLLLQYMVEKGQIEKTQNGIIIGEKGELIANRFDFYSVFETQVEYIVRDKFTEIGTLNRPLAAGQTFPLNGQSWKVRSLDLKNKIIQVEAAEGKGRSNGTGSWIGNSGYFQQTRVMKKMREIIRSSSSYGYLDPSAELRLENMRLAFSGAESDLFQILPGTYGLYPWLGTKALNALVFALKGRLSDEINLDGSNWHTLIIKNVEYEDLVQALNEVKRGKINIDDLVIPEKFSASGKYGEFVPGELLLKQFIDKNIDIEEMQSEFLWE